MKRLLALLVCLMLLAGSALPVMACKHHRRAYAGSSRRYQTRYSRAAYNRGSTYRQRAYYGYNHHRSFWERHRDKLTLAIGTGGGAALGGLLGGRRGAGYGALVGLGSSALYTYKLRDRRRRY